MAFLKWIGIKAGDAVGIDMPMTVEAVVAYLGTILYGAVVVSVADSFGGIKFIINFDGIKFVNMHFSLLV